MFFFFNSFIIPITSHNDLWKITLKKFIQYESIVSIIFKLYLIDLINIKSFDLNLTIF